MNKVRFLLGGFVLSVSLIAGCTSASTTGSGNKMGDGKMGNDKMGKMGGDKMDKMGDGKMDKMGDGKMDKMEGDKMEKK